MHTFFYPQSLVVFGVSVSKINLGTIVILNNLQNGYRGRLYGVGSQEGEIQGVKVYRSVLDLPETPDVAIFLTPARTVPPLMEECGKKGIRHIVIESGGFSEYSHGDTTLEDEVLAIVRKYDMKLIGPNCVGTINFDINMMMPFGFFRDFKPGGKVGLISQSGGIGGSYLRFIAGSGIRPGKFVAIGNKLVLDEADFLDYLLKDEGTEMVTVYLEGFKRGRAFHELAMAAQKPIIIQKSNRSPVSARIAQSHTAALATDDEVCNASFKQSAVVRVEDERELSSAVKVLRLPPMKGRRVAVLSRSGGHAVLSADACAEFGFEMVPFPRSFIEKLKTMYNTRVIAHQNPLDLGEIFDYTIFTDILEEVLKLGEIDGVLFNHLYSAHYEAESSRTFLSGVEKLVGKYGKPVAVAVISERREIIDLIENHPYPIFENPREAAHALHIAATYYERKKFRDERGNEVLLDLDREAIGAIFEQCRREKRMPLMPEAFEVCEKAGIRVVPWRVVQKEEEISQVSLSYPVVMKLISEKASHKSDVGGVALEVKTVSQAKSVWRRMEKKFRAWEPKGYLIQEMAPKGLEFIVGGKKDPSFGPVVMVGLGGLYVEVFRDTALRLAPITRREAEEMVRELKSYELLKGVRGQGPFDVDAFIDVVCGVSSLMAQCPEITEIDLNPVICHPKGQGVSVVDARLVITQGPA
ncbi:MAG TPA: acetate--CoA ligase family protein [Syntrophales bacterium]|nr:acetate--CoA ligase family protein [Syntrophales bacterium]HOL59299.1 acetate--CoA ligase family protein [Syntrophales bacterium]HPO35508.1 acetate--CoA ligase family protein [Syntrophales bacterium]